MVYDFDVEIEATNNCNTRCLHCPHESLARPMGKMSWESYQKIIDKIFEYTTTKGLSVSVDFAGMGEPLLNPFIYDFVRYASRKAFTAITTNGSALTPQNIRKLIEAGLSLLIVSFNGADIFTYELMMGGLSFERAERHLKTALELTRGTSTNIAVNLSITKQTQSKIQEITEYLSQIGINNISLSKCHNRGNKLNNPNVCDTPMPPSYLKSRCDIFEQTLFVAWNGDVLSCCHDLEGENVLGNLLSETIEEILNKKKKVLESGLNYKICRTCNDLYRFRSDLHDGIPLNEWLYDLYTEKEISYPELLDWVYNIYVQEGRHQYFIQRLWENVTKLDRIVAEKDERIKILENQVNSLESEMDSIRKSETWQIAQRIQKIRTRLLPHHSIGEKVLRKIVSE